MCYYRTKRARPPPENKYATETACREKQNHGDVSYGLWFWRRARLYPYEDSETITKDGQIERDNEPPGASEGAMMVVNCSERL
jgi:hypothetical protein